jgi:hypothetical protein
MPLRPCSAGYGLKGPEAKGERMLTGCSGKPDAGLNGRRS